MLKNKILSAVIAGLIVSVLASPLVLADDEAKSLLTVPVLLSVTRNSDLDVAFDLLYQGKDNHNQRHSGRIEVSYVDDWVDEASSVHQGSFSGRLVTLNLPVGDYQFYRLSIDDGYEQAVWTTGKRISVPFSVRGKDPVYIGNIHFISEFGSSHTELLTRYYFTDAYDRDSQKADVIYPDLGVINKPEMIKPTEGSIKYLGSECQRC